MALETLKDVTEIGGIAVYRVKWANPPDHFIEINDGDNAITFKIQNGPIRENGLNGCQVDTIILTAKKIIEGLNAKFPCRENSLVITKLDEALMWLDARTKRRLTEGIEGTNVESTPTVNP